MPQNRPFTKTGEPDESILRPPTASIISPKQVRYKLLISLMIVLVFLFSACGAADAKLQSSNISDTTGYDEDSVKTETTGIVFDTADYIDRTQLMANGDSSGKWPVKDVFPLPGAILPFKRVVSYYGNLYSRRMGILGELPPREMLTKLEAEVKRWEAADSTTPVIPALHYIAVTAQASPGPAGKYRLRMPFHQIDSVLNMAKRINAIVFIDIQVGLSTLREEIPPLEKYLSMPNVHLGIDPEFSMKGGNRPGTVIGSFDAADINYTAGYVAELVNKYNLPPKILVIHRFTQAMVTNYRQIKLRPEVQYVIDMDGWGHQARKRTTYQRFAYGEPVQFTGFKLFYKNDLREANSRVMTPEEVLKLKPKPLYIQYQ